MDQNEQKELAIAMAKRVINLSLGIFIFCICWILQDGLFPDLFKPAHDLTELNGEETEPLISESYPAAVSLDSADIENGIHLPTGLIVDTGVEDVMTTCGACHSLDLVTQNRATREGWKEIIVWMQETQKLWDLGAKEDIILDYLAKNYAPENEGRRRNLIVEEWYELH